jgi:hypothetical protein
LKVCVNVEVDLAISCVMCSFCMKRTTKELTLFIPVRRAFLVEEGNVNLFEMDIFTYVSREMNAKLEVKNI